MGALALWSLKIQSGPLSVGASLRWARQARAPAAAAAAAPGTPQTL